MNYLKININIIQEVNLDGNTWKQSLSRSSDRFDYKPGNLDSMRSAIDAATSFIEGCQELGDNPGVELEFGRQDGTIIDVLNGCDIKDVKEIIKTMCII